MKWKLLKLVTLIVLLPLHLLGQIDTEFWFAAPDITSEYGQAPKNGAPISLHFTALYATTVTISRPADPTFAPIQITLQDLEHKSIELSAILPINQIETYPRALTDPTAFQDKGFKITAYPGEISCYYELDNKLNKDIFPLKGTNGLGKEFFVSTQNNFVNGDYKGTAWSGFVIVATEDNTTITVELNDDLLHFVPHPATVTINLNAGQTYAFRALSTLPSRHINGVRVTSDNNIAITVYDDAMQKERNVGGTSWDLFGDQIVPLDIVGTEYIVMKGFMVDAPEDGGERIFVTATEDNTAIYIDNNPVPVAIINKGQVYSYAIMNQTT
ncbi:MAG TPA: IgGFc-binding protein, partial [Bacteroidales bacterium]|nr:IgGFc-binding protein [Bacteroidales bacterium]